MVYSNEDEGVIYLWWDVRNEFREGCKYRVMVDGRAVVFAKDRLYDFYNMDTSVHHTFDIDLIDENGNVVGETESYVSTLTLPKKSALDVTKPPFNAVGDGVTDCTFAIRQAFEKCNESAYVYFPLGTYVCEEINFSGNVKVVFDAGATVINKDKVGKVC